MCTCLAKTVVCMCSVVIVFMMPVFRGSFVHFSLCTCLAKTMCSVVIMKVMSLFHGVAIRGAVDL